MQSPDLQAKISVWRQKAKDGTLTQDEMRDAIAAIRGERKGAANASAQSKVNKAKAVIPDAKALLADLGSMK